MRENTRENIIINTIKRSILSVILIALIISTASCNRPRQITDNLFALDTYITFTLSGGRAKAGLAAAEKRLREIEYRMSATRADSDITKVNNSAGKQPVKVNQDTFYVIKKALEYAELTGGAFDISMLPVERLWNITGENPRVPTEDEIKERLKMVDYKKIRLNEAELTVFLEEEGMMIDLGGIAKGYAGDEIKRVLKEYGVTNALINLGGDIVVINGKENGTPWRIGIQNPRMEENQSKKHVAVIDTKGNAIVTSGDYERYMVEYYEKTGIRYHHIFDPKTGFPAVSGLISVTVVGENAIDTDALSTSIFILGLKDGLKLADSLENIETMIITEDKKVYFSKGLKDKVSVADTDYRVAN